MTIDEIKGGITWRAAAISAAAEEIGALILGVEGMIADQRRLLAETNASKYLQESPLWAGMEVLLEITKRTADLIEENGTAIQTEAMAT